MHKNSSNVYKIHFVMYLYMYIFKLPRLLCMTITQCSSTIFLCKIIMTNASTCTPGLVRPQPEPTPAQFDLSPNLNTGEKG